MSESEKNVPILKWPMELESLKALLLAFAILCLSNGCRPSSAKPPDSLSGRWTGSGIFRGQTDPAIMDFYQIPGGWRAFGGRADLLDYPSIPLRNIRYQHPHISFDITDGPEHLSFEGTVSGKTIKVVSRGQTQVVLELQRTGDAPPLPFTEEAIEVRNGELKLVGDLLLPSGPGPHPAIVLIHGSGKGTRDSCRIFGDLFVRYGVAALLYDKRDAGPDRAGAEVGDVRDLAGDALAAVALLKARDDIRDDQIGLWGVSQGGMVAPIAAAQSGDVAFVIVVSTSGVSYADLWHFQTEYGASDDKVPANTSAERTGEALRRAGNTRHTIKVFPGADHGIMLALNPATSEKGSAGANKRTNFAPGYLDTMTGWLREQLGLAR